MEQGIVLSQIEEPLQKIQALADALMMIGKLDESETPIKPATIETLGNMINHYVIKIFEALEESANGR